MTHPADTPTAESSGSLFAAFATVARSAPGAVAVADDKERLTYGELADRARETAELLRRHGVGPGRTVAVRMAPRAELLVVLLGILASGAAYLPLNEPAVPERESLILSDARPAVLVEDADGSGAAGGPGGGVAPTATTRLRSLAGGDAVRVPDGTAYVIYTSGTTGRPKGAAVSHRNVLALFAATRPCSASAPTTGGCSSTPSPSTSRCGRSGAPCCTAARWTWSPAGCSRGTPRSART